MLSRGRIVIDSPSNDSTTRPSSPERPSSETQAEGKESLYVFEPRAAVPPALLAVIFPILFSTRITLSFIIMRYSVRIIKNIFALGAKIRRGFPKNRAGQ